MSKMLFVKSNDYWGYDASQFDDTVNFYRFTWVVPEAMYETLDSDDQSSLNPCALFYVQGVTDNHNFLTLKIAQDGDEAKVSGMQGTKRRTRRYNIGSPAQYSVGSYALQQAPAGATSVEAIKTAVESGSTSEGSFNVSEFLTEAADIAAAVNMVTEDKSAETFEANPKPRRKMECGECHATGFISGKECSTCDGAGYWMIFAPKCGTCNSDITGTSGAECDSCEAWACDACLGDDSACPQCGDTDLSYHAETFAAPSEVPSGSAYEPADPTVANPATEGYSESDLVTMDEFSAMEYTPEIGGYPGLPVIPDSYGENSAGEGFGVPVWYGSAEEDSEEYTFTFTVYDNATGEEIDDGEVSVTAANETEARGEAMRMLEEGGLDDEEFVLDAEGGRLRDIRGKFMNRRKAKDAVFGEVMSQQMSGYYRTGIVGDNPPVGQNIARRNPAAKARYFIEPGVQNPNSGEWSKGPNFQQARKIAKGVAWDTVQDMGLAAETAGLEMTTLGDSEFPVVPDSYGESSAVVSGRGVPQWYGSAETEGFNAMPTSSYNEEEWSKTKANDFERSNVSGYVMFRGRIMPCMNCKKAATRIYGSRNDPVYVCDNYNCIDASNLSNASPLQINDAEYEAQSITETLEEAAPVSLKKPVLVAAISALTGFLIARRKA